MKRWSVLAALFTAAAVVSMVLPIGRVSHQLPVSLSSYREFRWVSYLTPTAWEYGYYFPFLAALMAVAVLVLLLIRLMKRGEVPLLSTLSLAFSCNGAVLALLALLPTPWFVTVTPGSVSIAALLVLAAAVLLAGRVWGKHRLPEREDAPEQTQG